MTTLVFVDLVEILQGIFHGLFSFYHHLDSLLWFEWPQNFFKHRLDGFLGIKDLVYKDFCDIVVKKIINKVI